MFAAFMITLFFFCVIGLLGFWAGNFWWRTKEMQNQQQLDAHADAIMKVLPEFVEGDMRYDNRGWVYVFTAGGWKQVVVRDRALKREEFGEDGLNFTKAFTLEEENQLPYKRQYQRSLKMLRETR